MLKIAVAILIVASGIFIFLNINHYLATRHMDEAMQLDFSTGKILSDFNAALYAGDPVGYFPDYVANSAVEATFEQGRKAFLGVGGAKNEYLGRSLLADAAKRGSVRAMDLLGSLYDSAKIDGKQDIESAVLWYEKSAGYGSLAGNQYACKYYFLKNQHSKAFPYCEISATQGVPMSGALLGGIYMSGRGVSRDADKGASYLCKAKAGGRKVGNMIAKYGIDCN